jgi:short subunit dehydrogenase-like uncharacterized protein
VTNIKHNRDLDIVVFGATGFTGTADVKKQLGESAADLEAIVADSSDKDALASLAARTRVVLTTVGPYALYGSKLVAACANAGTDYCAVDTKDDRYVP